jgi:hypothetical protein
LHIKRVEVYISLDITAVRNLFVLLVARCHWALCGYIPVESYRFKGAVFNKLVLSQQYLIFRSDAAICFTFTFLNEHNS